MEKWKECTISDIGTVVGGATPSTKVPENYIEGRIAWITPKDLSTFHSRYIEHGERNITERGLHTCSTTLLPPNTILFSSRAPIGYIAIAKNALCTNQGFKNIIPNTNIHPLFLYYLLKNNKDRIENMGSGTTFKEVSAAVMNSISIRIPEKIQIQQKITKLLGSLDDKIELNRQINANLEQQAQAIFKSWFIDFEPSGGTMPDDWQKACLLDIADYTNGLAMQKYRPTSHEQGIFVMKIKELRQGFCDSSSELCSNTVNPFYLIHNGDVIFSWSGSLLVDFWCGGLCGLNQHLFKVTSNKYAKWFYYCWTKFHLHHFITEAADKATTMGHIKRENLAKAEVVIPTKQVYLTVGDLLGQIYNLMIANRIEINTLSALRDTLLPKLMSGEIDVSKIEID